MSGAATALVARKVRERARLVAAAMLEAAPEDLRVKGPAAAGRSRATRAGATIHEIALRRAARSSSPTAGGGPGRRGVYDPNLTFPFGAYLCVVDIDPGTAAVKVRRFVAVDDCGTRINPMIVEGQIHGGLTDGVGMALMETSPSTRTATAWVGR